MKFKDQFEALIQAQDLIRRVWAHHDGTILTQNLRETDRELTKIINQLGKMIKPSQEV